MKNNNIISAKAEKQNKYSKFFFWGAIVLIVIQFFTQLYLAKYESQTTDEAIHLSAGYTYLTRGDFRFNPEHPILPKMLSAITLLFINVNIPDDSLYWDQANNFLYDNWQENRIFAEKMLYDSGNNAALILFLSRISTVVLALILATSIFLISKKHFGVKAGFFATLIFVTNPVVNAHAHFVTTDLAIALGYLLSIFTFYNFLQKPSWKNVVYFILATALAFLMKFTAVILVPVFIGLFIYYIYKNKLNRKDVYDYIKKMILSMIGVWVLIIFVYSFSLSIPESSSVLLQDGKFLLINIADNTIAKVYDIVRYFFIPKDYIKGLIMVVSHTQGGHFSFLLGMTSNTGWWYYFPVLFVLKNTIAFLVLCFISAYLFVVNKKSKNNFSIFIFLAALGYLIFAMLSKANLGIRHILPIFPMLAIISAQIFDYKNKTIRYIAYTLAIIVFFESIIIFPNNLSYYNQFAGGSENGQNIATDSNFDWGQDLKKIRDYVEKNSIKRPYIEYTWAGMSSLDYYFLDNYQNPNDLDIKNPEGTLIIGATALSNNGHYKFLKNYQPTDRITDSVFVYKFQ